MGSKVHKKWSEITKTFSLVVFWEVPDSHWGTVSVLLRFQVPTLLDLGNRLGTTGVQILGAASRDGYQSQEVRDDLSSALQQGARKPNPLSQSRWWFCLRMEDVWSTGSRWGSQSR